MLHGIGGKYMTQWRILFDYDDTLIRHDNEQELKVMVDYLGIELTENIKTELIDFYAKMSNHFRGVRLNRRIFNEFIEDSLPLLKHNGISTQKFLEAQIYKDRNYPMLMEGAIEVLEYLKGKNYFLCVFTNGFYDEQISSLKSQGIYDYFDRLYAWDNFYAKPDERAFIRALNGTKPCDNIMIGNSIENDIEPAKKLGIYTFGYNLDKNSRTKPDEVLISLKDLKCYL